MNQSQRFEIAIGWGDPGYRAKTVGGLTSNEYCAVNDSIAWQKAIVACLEGDSVAEIWKDGAIVIQARQVLRYVDALGDRYRDVKTGRVLVERTITSGGNETRKEQWRRANQAEYRWMRRIDTPNSFLSYAIDTMEDCMPPNPSLPITFCGTQEVLGAAGSNPWDVLDWLNGLPECGDAIVLGEGEEGDR